MLTRVYAKEVNTVWALEKQRPYVADASEIIVEQDMPSEYLLVNWFTKDMIEEVIARGEIKIDNAVYTFSHSEYSVNKEPVCRNIFLIAKTEEKGYFLSIEDKERLNTVFTSLKHSIYNQIEQRDYYNEETLEDRMKYYRDEKEKLETKLFQAKVWITTFMGIATVLAIILLTGRGAA